MANVGIKNNYALLSFVSGKKLQIGDFANKETGETFKSLILTDESGNHKFIHFSSKLGELTPAEIKARKDELQVVELESGSYVLCKKGENNWEDVNLFD